MSSKVAVLGLGLMGAGMAGQLLAKGFDLAVWNRDGAKSAPFGARGARVATTPAAAVVGAEVVVAMLAHDEASRTVWLGADGALAAMEAGAVAVECSTLSPGWIAGLAAAAEARGLFLVDAPVTGSTANAEAGDLRFLAGGRSEALDKAAHVLLAMGNSIVPLGKSGCGAVMKLINNFMCAVQSATLAEALVMAERSGLDVTQVAEALGTGAPGSPHVRALAQRMLARDYRPNFTPPLMVKDLDYAIAAFSEQGITLATAAAARARHADAAARAPDQDIAVVIEPIRGGD